MKKYKVEYQKAETFCIDVEANSIQEAKKKADLKWQQAERLNTEQYYQTGDTIINIGTVYDVSNTDDPFNP